MSRITLIGTVSLILMSCQQQLPGKTKKQLKQTENFWKQRNRLITMEKTKIEFPQKIDTTLTERRVNRIYIDNMECQFEVFVDDVLLLRIMGPITQNGGGISGDHDINQLLLTSGKHEVMVRMYPKFKQTVFGEEGYVNLKFSHFTRETFKKPIYFSDMNAHNGVHIDQSEKQWIEKWDQENQVGYDGDYVEKQPHKFKGFPVYEWHSIFKAEVPFDMVGWRNSINLRKEEYEEKKDIRNEVFAEYKKIYELIEKRDVQAYLNLVKEREELVTQALHYRENEKKARAEEFVKLIQDPDYEIEPMYAETFQLDYQGYGKLVSLVNKIDGEGIIRLKNNKNHDDCVYLDFRFQRKHKGDKLTVI
ncbi:hypothetical protein IM793_15130 [Pedobacter sp. MR2016-19]|uniref:hypothetical protein n=1 Tax=Pedobacter sp. MR2016-19 TaxID=2780089 RepID=UPI0018765994|nr:hypothetical protein [Pedobacter sp. MR2016-19]MBE5320498.1 hypothetical protein [Pedobacter sp. MR2016-19]